MGVLGHDSVAAQVPGEVRSTHAFGTVFSLFPVIRSVGADTGPTAGGARRSGAAAKAAGTDSRSIRIRPATSMPRNSPMAANAPANADGNFILGPTHPAAPEMAVQDGVPQGDVYEFTMASTDSKIYPGIAREPGTFAAPDPKDPGKVTVNSHPAPYTRKVAVYVPKQYKPGTDAPFIVGADGPDKSLFVALDNLIAQHRVPVMIAISIRNGSGDGQGSQRGSRIRHHVRPLRRVCGKRSAAARRKTSTK